MEKKLEEMEKKVLLKSVRAEDRAGLGCTLPTPSLYDLLDVRKGINHGLLELAPSPFLIQRG